MKIAKISTKGQIKLPKLYGHNRLNKGSDSGAAFLSRATRRIFTKQNM